MKTKQQILEDRLRPIIRKLLKEDFGNITPDTHTPEWQQMFKKIDDLKVKYVELEKELKKVKVELRDMIQELPHESYSDLSNGNLIYVARNLDHKFGNVRLNHLVDLKKSLESK